MGSPQGLGSYLTDVLEVLDVHALGVHDLLDDIGPHLVLALQVFVAVLAGIFLLLLALGAAGILRQLLLIDTQLRATHRCQVTWGKAVTEAGGRPPQGFRFSVAVRKAAWPEAKSSRTHRTTAGPVAPTTAAVLNN